MILLIVWDGLRPAMITAEHTPYLAQMAEEGVFCSASHAVFPTATRINSTSLSTGCYPRQHGLVDNEVYVPALDPEKTISCADWEALQRMADLEGEEAPDIVEIDQSTRESANETRGGARRQTVHHSHMGQNTYLDQVTLE
ncbi:MAG: alkaline phosphatase family protein [Anaerolineales bacterium]